MSAPVDPSPAVKEAGKKRNSNSNSNTSRSQAHQTAVSLTTTQVHALFDILTHHQTYREIQSFADPATISSYGYPFVTESAAAKTEPEETRYASSSATPILHLLLNKFVLTLPPAQQLPPAFWSVRVQGLMTLLGEAELSESYDQGALGTRKTLATAASALLESAARGLLGGYPLSRDGAQSRRPPKDENEYGRQVDETVKTAKYDAQKAGDSLRAWDDVMRAMIYGSLTDELFAFVATHENVEDHSEAVKTAVDYVIMHLAEFLHSVFIASPNGRYLTKLVETIQTLAPYGVVRQTLRVSNAATMVHAMMKVLLAKLSVGGLTNWMGLTTAADDGMNLLQRVVSMVLAWDGNQFRKAADRIERHAVLRDRRAVLSAVRNHVTTASRAEHDRVRLWSRQQSVSMVTAVLADRDVRVVLSEEQHTLCAQYYAAQLSMRDRRVLTDVFCRQSPDLFTQALRDGVGALEPLLRRVHEQIDLKEHVTDGEQFLNEFLRVCKGVDKDKDNKDKDKDRKVPGVPEFVALLQRNRHLLYKWLHRVAADTPTIRETFRQWATTTMQTFRDSEAKNMEGRLRNLFAKLDATTQQKLVPQLGAHAAYLATLDAGALRQRQRLLNNIYGLPPSSSSSSSSCPSSSSSSPPSTSSSSTALALSSFSPSSSSPSFSSDSDASHGSGRFLARWQALLDETVIAPATATGPLRRGRDVANTTGAGREREDKDGADNNSNSNSLSRNTSSTRLDSLRESLRDLGYRDSRENSRSGRSSALASRKGSPERKREKGDDKRAKREKEEKGEDKGRAKREKEKDKGRAKRGEKKRKKAVTPPDVHAVVAALSTDFHVLLQDAVWMRA